MRLGTAEISEDRLKQICEARRVRRLWLFGSAARDDFDPECSDIDFLVEFEPHERRGLDDVFFMLHEDLKKLTGRPVDLVEFDAIRNPYIRKAAEESRIPLYVAA